MLRILLLLILFLLACTSCAPQYEESDGLVDFTDIPAEWGQLVTVTKYKESGYYELWFSNTETGSITHVPLNRQTWKIKLEKVRTIPRGETTVDLLRVGGGS